MADYIGVYPVTKEELDKVEVGDYIRVNNWYRAMQVRAVSENYIVCANRSFDGNFIYSVISKQPSTFYNHEAKEQLCYCGKDNTLFGAGFKCDFDNVDSCKEYLKKFESGELEISRKRSEAIYRIALRSKDA